MSQKKYLTKEEMLQAIEDEGFCKAMKKLNVGPVAWYRLCKVHGIDSPKPHSFDKHIQMVRVMVKKIMDKPGEWDLTNVCYEIGRSKFSDDIRTGEVQRAMEFVIGGGG